MINWWSAICVKHDISPNEKDFLRVFFLISVNVIEKIYMLKTFTDIISRKITQKRGSLNKNFVNFLSLSLLLIAHLEIQALCKMQEFHLIFWCWNFVERNIFCGVSDELPETLLKLCFFTKSTHQEIKWRYWRREGCSLNLSKATKELELLPPTPPSGKTLLNNIVTKLVLKKEVL